jgi:hypothetical protein
MMAVRNRSRQVCMTQTSSKAPTTVSLAGEEAVKRILIGTVAAGN